MHHLDLLVIGRPMHFIDMAVARYDSVRLSHCLHLYSRFDAMLQRLINPPNARDDPLRLF